MSISPELLAAARSSDSFTRRVALRKIFVVSGAFRAVNAKRVEEEGDGYERASDVPMGIIVAAVAPYLHPAAQASVTTSTAEVVEAAAKAVEAPVVETKPAAQTPQPAQPAVKRVPAPSATTPRPGLVACCQPGCSQHGLPGYMRVKPQRLIRAELGRDPTEAELVARAYCPCHVPTREHYPLASALEFLGRSASKGSKGGGKSGKPQQAQARPPAPQVRAPAPKPQARTTGTGFGTLGDLLGEALKKR